METGGVHRSGRSGWAGACRWLATTGSQRDEGDSTQSRPLKYFLQTFEAACIAFLPSPFP